MMDLSIAYVIFALTSAAFFGSWHCALMCGPIASAMSRKKAGAEYAMGRLVSYTLLGAVAGELGRKVFALVSPTAKLVGLGVLTFLLLAGYFPQMRARLKVFSRMRANGITSRPFLFGVFSVLLPCGWLWTFVAAAVASGSGWSGALILFALWLSSLPALSLITFYFRRSGQKAAPLQLLWLSRMLTFAALVSVWSHFWI